MSSKVHAKQCSKNELTLARSINFGKNKQPVESALQNSTTVGILIPIELLQDHPYIKSAKGLGGWGQKNCHFADVQYYLC